MPRRQTVFRFPDVCALHFVFFRPPLRHANRPSRNDAPKSNPPYVIMPEQAKLLLKEKLATIFVAPASSAQHPAAAASYLSSLTAQNYSTSNPATPLLESAQAAVFEDLWRRGYWVTGAAGYGADFLVYADEPRRCHAFAAVLVLSSAAPRKDPVDLTTSAAAEPSRSDEIHPISIAAFVRAQTAVAKHAVLACVTLGLKENGGDGHASSDAGEFYVACSPPLADTRKGPSERDPGEASLAVFEERSTVAAVGWINATAAKDVTTSDVGRKGASTELEDCSSCDLTTSQVDRDDALHEAPGQSTPASAALLLAADATAARRSPSEGVAGGGGADAGGDLLLLPSYGGQMVEETSFAFVADLPARVRYLTLDFAGAGSRPAALARKQK
ncbi:unnamed protein product [Phaeothamnion confervicola]